MDCGKPLLANTERSGSWPIDELIEGVHYYLEGELMVFMEAYHLARGVCCGSRCRHCPFNHEHVDRPG